jgi:hypothetical protein
MKHTKKHKKKRDKSFRKTFKAGNETLFNFTQNNSKEKASRKIKSFMVSNRSKIKSLFLKTICADSGFCMDFGIESKNIKSFFNNFITGEFFVSPVIRIGQVSNNGFVNLINYEREGYKINTTLKSSTSFRSDNLYYEYLVGKFINKYTKIFPCFLETYGLFAYNRENDWEYVKNHKKIEDNILQTRLTNIPHLSTGDSCKYAKYIAILTQYINNSQTLYEKIIERNDTMFPFDLVNILFQIYMPLAMLSDKFTHYDLHLKNILIYEPMKNKYIHYHYHINDSSVDFKSKYMVKIIDYGRAYFKDESMDSLTIYNKICKSQECGGTKCGIDYGYETLIPERFIGNRNYITSYQSNISHDLRFAHMLKKNISSNWSINTKRLHASELFTLLESIIYSGNYGTREILKNNTTTTSTYNVIHMKKKLDYLLQTITPRDTFYIDAGYTKLGDLHIYEDAPMKFIPV